MAGAVCGGHATTAAHPAMCSAAAATAAGHRVGLPAGGVLASLALPAAAAAAASEATTLATRLGAEASHASVEGSSRRVRRQAPCRAGVARRLRYRISR